MFRAREERNVYVNGGGGRGVGLMSTISSQKEREKGFCWWQRRRWRVLCKKIEKKWVAEVFCWDKGVKGFAMFFN